jgi:hypothetical protein
VKRANTTTISGTCYLLLSLIALICILAAAELVTYFLVGGLLVRSGTNYSFLFYRPEIKADDSKVAKYFTERDKILGWPRRIAWEAMSMMLAGRGPYRHSRILLKQHVSLYTEIPMCTGMR